MVKKRSVGQIVFDEIAKPASSQFKKKRLNDKNPASLDLLEPQLISAKRQDRVSTGKSPKPKVIRQPNAKQKEQSAKDSSRKIHATYNEGSQFIQMTVDAQDDELFEDEQGSEDEVDLSLLQDVGQSEQEDGSEGESEPEEGLIHEENVMNDTADNSSHASHNSRETQEKLDLIDQHMQQRILDLHDKMEESGFHGAVNLIEQLFDNKPGEDKKKKYKLKKSIRSGMRRQENARQLVNSNANRNQVTKNLNIPVDTLNTVSETPIYQNAVQKRISSSSEDDGLDLSDKSYLLNSLVLDLNERTEDQRVKDTVPPVPMVQLSTSRPRDPSPEEQAAHMVRLSERAKANMLPPKGEIPNDLNRQSGDNFRFIAQMDQDYIIVGAHIEEALQQKIIKGQYVDFSKLLPKDKLVEDDGCMELIIKEGRSYWVPASNAESVQISNFNKWEQAYRVFANIYTKAYPDRAGELIEYNHVIHSISHTYVWDNVYSYDKDFTLHLSRHPERSWAIILQQAWSM